MGLLFSDSLTLSALSLAYLSDLIATSSLAVGCQCQTSPSAFYSLSSQTDSFFSPLYLSALVRI